MKYAVIAILQNYDWIDEVICLKLFQSIGNASEYIELLNKEIYIKDRQRILYVEEFIKNNVEMPQSNGYFEGCNVSAPHKLANHQFFIVNLEQNYGLEES